MTEVAATHHEALDAVARKRPGLVLADIQLADGSSGIDAVKDILQSYDVPVIFITAFPERLLTGERPEPTFLITKPFQPETVKAAIGQGPVLPPRKGQGSRLESPLNLTCETKAAPLPARPSRFGARAHGAGDGVFTCLRSPGDVAKISPGDRCGKSIRCRRRPESPRTAPAI